MRHCSRFKEFLDEAAKANLQIARNHLEMYRGLTGNSDEAVRDLDKEIETVMNEIEDPGAAEKINGFWDRLTGWFTAGAGQAQKIKSEDSSPQPDAVPGEQTYAQKNGAAVNQEK